MATDRYLDLLKQGFMKPSKPTRKKQEKKPQEMISCEGCNNWHYKGKHTEPDAKVRRKNIKSWNEFRQSRGNQ